MVDISEVRTVSDEVVEGIAALVPQLSSSAVAPDKAAVTEMVDSPAVHLLVARDGAEGPIVGTLTLAVFRIPTGVRAWIEDVIVDASAERRGIGEALSRRALGLAGEAGARTVELTSRPARQAANRLYQRIGFEARDTNVYRYRIAD